MTAPSQEQAAPGGDDPRRRPWRSRWVLAAALVLLVAGFYALGLHRRLSWDSIRGHLGALKSWVDEKPAPAVLLFFLVYVAVTALSVPSAAALSLLAGALFGRWLGTAVVLLAATLGATLAFLTSRYLFRDAVRRRCGARLEALDRGVRRDGAYYLFTLRLVPAFPFFFINLGMGLTPLPARTFAWVSLLGMQPGTFLYVNARQAAGEVASPRDVLSPGVLASFALLGIFPLAVRLFVRRVSGA
jgi:uncharacterized membrane protein YdjX (TVP38/TMEM64 family)